MLKRIHTVALAVAGALAVGLMPAGAASAAADTDVDFFAEGFCLDGGTVGVIVDTDLVDADAYTVRVNWNEGATQRSADYPLDVPFWYFDVETATVINSVVVREGTTSVATFGRFECAPSFSDVPVDHPFFGDIEWMAFGGISAGYDDGTFRPAVSVSRQAMAAFMYRFAFEPPFDPPATATFRDVPTSSPFFLEVEWMAAEGISTGFSDDTFRPTSPVSRQAMSAFLFRLVETDAYEGGPVPSFSDVPAGSGFYDSVEWMAELGISTGYDDGTFRPTSAVSRQAMSAFMRRADFYYE